MSKKQLRRRSPTSKTSAGNSEEHHKKARLPALAASLPALLCLLCPIRPCHSPKICRPAVPYLPLICSGLPCSGSLIPTTPCPALPLLPCRQISTITCIHAYIVHIRAYMYAFGLYCFAHRFAWGACAFMFATCLHWAHVHL